MSSPVSILFTIPNFITAGSGGAMLNIVKRLDRDRFAPAVAVLKKGGRLDTEVEQLGIPLIEAGFVLPPKPYATLLARAWSAGKVFRPYRFAIWHSFHYSDDYTEALVARLNGASHWVFTKKNMNWNRRAWYLRTLLASGIAVQNIDMMKRFFTNRQIARKCYSIPRGVDTQKFSPRRDPGRAFREACGIPDGRTVISCVAQLLPVKGHQTLIEAVQQLSGVHLLLAGSTSDSEHTAKLVQLARECGVAERVHFLGGVGDIPGLLAETDIFVLPTNGKGEGCPVALLEAMACGKACIATDIPGSRDLITHGDNGLLVPPESPGALAAAIRTLIDAPAVRAAYGEYARRTVEDHFSIEREVQAHEALYARLLERHG